MENNSKITKDMIFNSSKKIGIIVSLDNNEKYLINISWGLKENSAIQYPDKLISEYLYVYNRSDNNINNKDEN